MVTPFIDVGDPFPIIPFCGLGVDVWMVVDVVVSIFQDDVELVVLQDTNIGFGTVKVSVHLGEEDAALGGDRTVFFLLCRGLGKR